MAGGDHTGSRERRDRDQGDRAHGRYRDAGRNSRQVQIYSAGFCGGRLVSSLSLFGTRFFCCRNVLSRVVGGDSNLVRRKISHPIFPPTSISSKSQLTAMKLTIRLRSCSKNSVRV